MQHLRLVANLCLRDATASKSESSVLDTRHRT
jgi:hypothetical protein